MKLLKTESTKKRLNSVKLAEIRKKAALYAADNFMLSVKLQTELELLEDSEENK